MPSGSSAVVHGSGITSCDQAYSAAIPRVPPSRPAAAPNVSGLAFGLTRMATSSTQKATPSSSGSADCERPARTGIRVASERTMM
jgi:hypothetical protein